MCTWGCKLSPADLPNKQPLFVRMISTKDFFADIFNIDLAQRISWCGNTCFTNVPLRRDCHPELRTFSLDISQGRTDLIHCSNSSPSCQNLAHVNANAPFQIGGLWGTALTPSMVRTSLWIVLEIHANFLALKQQLCLCMTSLIVVTIFQFS